MEELRRRLLDAEKGWMDNKEECVQLTDQLNAAVREVHGQILHIPFFSKG